MSEACSGNFPRISLGQLATGHRGVSYRPELLKAFPDESTTTLLRATNIQNGSLTFSDVQFVPTSIVSRHQFLEPGDIAVCMSNGSKALVGKSAPYRSALETPHTVGAFCSVFKPSDRNSSDFVLHLFRSQAFQKSIDIALSGSAINNLKNSDIEGIWLQLPLRATWPRIAAILTSLDTAIEKTEALIEKHQQIKAGLMHDLFTRGLLPNGQLRLLREQAPALYQQTSLGWLPVDWAVVHMIELAEDRPGSTTIGPFGSDLIAKDYRNEGVPVVFVRDVKASGFEWNSNTYVTSDKANQLNAHSVKAGQVLATKMGLPPCISCVYPDWMPAGVITADMIRLSPDQAQVDGHWLSAGDVPGVVGT